MGALRKLLLAALIGKDRRVSMPQKGLFHADDGTLWQSGNPMDVGAEEFSSVGRFSRATGFS
jgi:hypothetical protein